MNDNKIPPTLSARHANPPRRILVVDDEPLLRQIYTEVLVTAGHKVDGAENGAVAWGALQATDYDLLITDNGMPKMSGVDLLKKIHLARMTLPVLMSTATPPDEIFLRHPELKPAITLLKPHTLADFLGAVEEILCAHENFSTKLGAPPAVQIQSPPKRLWLRLLAGDISQGDYGVAPPVG